MVDLITSVQIRMATRQDLPALEWNGEYTHFRRLYQEVYEGAVRAEALLWVADLDGTGVIGQLFVQLNSARKELADGDYVLTSMDFGSSRFTGDRGWVHTCCPW